MMPEGMPKVGLQDKPKMASRPTQHKHSHPFGGRKFVTSLDESSHKRCLDDQKNGNHSNESTKLDDEIGDDLLLCSNRNGNKSEGGPCFTQVQDLAGTLSFENSEVKRDHDNKQNSSPKYVDEPIQESENINNNVIPMNRCQGRFGSSSGGRAERTRTTVPVVPKENSRGSRNFTDVDNMSNRGSNERYHQSRYRTVKPSKSGGTCSCRHPRDVDNTRGNNANDVDRYGTSIPRSSTMECSNMGPKSQHANLFDLVRSNYSKSKRNVSNPDKTVNSPNGTLVKGENRDEMAHDPDYVTQKTCSNTDGTQQTPGTNSDPLSTVDTQRDTTSLSPSSVLLSTENKRVKPWKIYAVNTGKHQQFFRIVRSKQSGPTDELDEENSRGDKGCNSHSQNQIQRGKLFTIRGGNIEYDRTQNSSEEVKMNESEINSPRSVASQCDQSEIYFSSRLPDQINDREYNIQAENHSNHRGRSSCRHRRSSLRLIDHLEMTEMSNDEIRRNCDKENTTHDPFRRDFEHDRQHSSQHELSHTEITKSDVNFCGNKRESCSRQESFSANPTFCEKSRMPSFQANPQTSIHHHERGCSAQESVTTLSQIAAQKSFDDISEAGFRRNSHTSVVNQDANKSNQWQRKEFRGNRSRRRSIHSSLPRQEQPQQQWDLSSDSTPIVLNNNKHWNSSDPLMLKCDRCHALFLDDESVPDQVAMIPAINSDGEDQRQRRNSCVDRTIHDLSAAQQIARENVDGIRRFNPDPSMRNNHQFQSTREHLNNGNKQPTRDNQYRAMYETKGVRDYSGSHESGDYRSVAGSVNERNNHTVSSNFIDDWNDQHLGQEMLLRGESHETKDSAHFYSFDEDNQHGLKSNATTNTDNQIKIVHETPTFNSVEHPSSHPTFIRYRTIPRKVKNIYCPRKRVFIANNLPPQTNGTYSLGPTGDEDGGQNEIRNKDNGSERYLCRHSEELLRSSSFFSESSSEDTNFSILSPSTQTSCESDSLLYSGEQLSTISRETCTSPLRENRAPFRKGIKAINAERSNHRAYDLQQAHSNPESLNLLDLNIWGTGSRSSSFNNPNQRALGRSLSVERLHEMIRTVKQKSHTGKRNLERVHANLNSSNATAADSSGSSFLSDYILKLWENQWLCDVEVTVNGTQLLAHKLVLAAFSDVFCPNTPTPPPSVTFDIPDSTPQAVEQIFRYIYTSNMDLHDTLMEPVLCAALYMGIREVVNLVKDIIQYSDASNLHIYMEMCRRRNIAFDFSKTPAIQKQLGDLIQTGFFSSITKEQLLIILDDPNVEVESEEVTLRAVLQWAMTYEYSDPNVLPSLLKKITIESIPPKRLAAVMQDFREICQIQPVMEIFMDIFQMHAMYQEENDTTTRVSFYNDSTEDRDLPKASELQKSGNVLPATDKQSCPDPKPNLNVSFYPTSNKSKMASTLDIPGPESNVSFHPGTRKPGSPSSKASSYTTRSRNSPKLKPNSNVAFRGRKPLTDNPCISRFNQNSSQYSKFSPSLGTRTGRNNTRNKGCRLPLDSWRSRPTDSNSICRQRNASQNYGNERSKSASSFCDSDWGSHSTRNSRQQSCFQDQTPSKTSMETRVRFSDHDYPPRTRKKSQSPPAWRQNQNSRDFCTSHNNNNSMCNWQHSGPNQSLWTSEFCPNGNSSAETGSMPPPEAVVLNNTCQAFTKMVIDQRCSYDDGPVRRFSNSNGDTDSMSLTSASCIEQGTGISRFEHVNLNNDEDFEVISHDIEEENLADFGFEINEAGCPLSGPESSFSVDSDVATTTINDNSMTWTADSTINLTLDWNFLETRSLTPNDLQRPSDYRNHSPRMSRSLSFLGHDDSTSAFKEYKP